MNIREFCTSIAPVAVSGPREGKVNALVWDSRSVLPGSLFFALRGEKVDGHRFIGDAVARGATALVVEELVEVPDGVTLIRVENSRRAMAQAARIFYGDPAAGIPVVGITGTNGKTTSSYLIAEILRSAGYRPAVLGTISYRFEATVIEASHTTPESVTLLEHIRRFRDLGCTAVVMEVSSHALSQYRVDGISFSAALFTNLTPEHLDYHADMEEYFSAKRRLLDLVPEASCAAVNVDDLYGARLATLYPAAVTCAFGRGARLRGELTQMNLDGIRAQISLDGTPPVELVSPLVGRFNAENLLGALAVAVSLGIPLDQAVTAAGSVPPVAGRMERVEDSRGGTILVDYAHSPDALEKALQAVRELNPARTLVVFGCGGDRDRTKRPVMGELACRLADLAIITSDNPRTEEPASIIAEIEAGAKRVHGRAATGVGNGYLVIPDRREAIRFAVEQLRAGEVLLVAGKGHEDYQILGTVKHHFDDREEVRAALAGGIAC